jgi:hypothetical protein
MWPRVIAVCAAVACVVGCGSSSKSTSSTTTTASAGGPAPASLLGVYTTKLTNRDLARNHARELRVPPAWKLTIANSGGSGSGRALTLTNVKAGALEAPDFAVTGDRIVLKHEECAAGGNEHFYDNEYRFAQSGKTLRFTKVRNSCPDRGCGDPAHCRALEEEGRLSRYLKAGSGDCPRTRARRSRAHQRRGRSARAARCRRPPRAAAGATTRARANR